MTSLRTRVFVTVAVVLVAATGLSSVLSRRATLVEERQYVGSRQVAGVDVAGVLRPAYDAHGWPGVRDALVDIQGRTRTRYLVLDAEGRVVAASSPELANATARVNAGGGLSLQVREEGSVTSLEIRGIAPQPLTTAQGAELGSVYSLPADEGVTRGLPSGPPPWVVATLITGGVALLVTYLLSGHVLRPVRELTRATRRMQQGDLAVRVDARGDDEIARLARAFNAMAGRLDESERLKRQMVGDVAHELRSPVTNLRCTLEAMQDGLVALDRSAIDALHDETLLLQRLISDLQDLALADAGGLPLHVTDVDVAEVVERAVGRERERPRVAVTIAAGLSHVAADAARVEQMIRNLLSNARRHTPESGRIDVGVHQADELVLVTVSDTGAGIAPEHLPLVFERFYRADPSRDRASGGAGLGLAIVKRLAEAHGGTVRAHSDGAGRGSTFTIALPVQRS